MLGPDVKNVMTKSSSDSVKGKERSRDECGLHVRHQHVAERLPVGSAQIARGLLLLLVERCKTRAHDHGDERKQKETCAMMMAPRLNGHGRSWGRGHDAREEEQHRHAHADLGYYDGERERALDDALERKPEAPKHNGGKRAEHQRKDRCHQGDRERIGNVSISSSLLKSFL